MKTLNVNLNENSYPIYIGDNLLKHSNLLQLHVTSKQVLIVSNPSVANWYLEDVKKAFSDRQCDVLLLPEGEQFKNIATLSDIFDTLIDKKHDRTTTLIALGGGVIGDITGF